MKHRGRYPWPIRRRVPATIGAMGALFTATTTAVVGGSWGGVGASTAPSGIMPGPVITIRGSSIRGPLDTPSGWDEGQYGAVRVRIDPRAYRPWWLDWAGPTIRTHARHPFRWWWNDLKGR